MRPSGGKNRNFREIFPGIYIVTACCFMFFLYATLELYFTNKNEFWFDFYTIAPVLLCLFLAATVLGCLGVFVLFLLNRRLYRAGLTACLIGYLASYIQGNYLIKNLPPLDGTAVDWSLYSGERIKCIALWILVIAAVLLLLHFVKTEKFYSIVKLISVCMTLMLAVTLAVVCISKEGLERKLKVNITGKNLFEMSDDTNFIIFVMDAVDARTMTELAETHPEYAQVFEDFTYYPNTVGAYAFTQMSIPYILSGEYFENDRPFADYSTHVYKNGTLFTALRQEGYKQGIYETDILTDDKSIFCFDNIESGLGTISDYREFLKAEIRLVGLKYAPFDLKRFCVFDMNVFQAMQHTEENDPLFYFENYVFYDGLQKIPVTHTEEKCFKFIHIEGGHVPFRYDKNVNFIDDATYESNVEASVTIAGKYLEKLKEDGVYDNTAIMILSDHGYPKPGETELERHNPILFVKGINEKHEMKISNAPISYEDLQEAYTRLRVGLGGEEVFDAREGDVRSRRYMYYKYLEEDHIEEYFVEGEAKDITSLVPSGREYNQKK